MKNECILSVIIPAYNAEKTICCTVESICKKFSAQVEVIVIDDASTDATVVEFNRLPYKNTKLLKQTRNGGQGAARNLGIKTAKGKYISFVDADDCVSDDYISSILSAIELGTDIDLFLFGVRNIKSGGIRQIECPDVVDLLSEFVLDKISCAPWAKVYLRKTINDHSIRFEDIKPGEDIAFNARYFRYTKRHKIILGLYYNYDCRQPSTTRSPYSFSVIESHRAANEILRQELSCLVEDFDSKYFARTFRYFFMHSMWRMANDSKQARLGPSLKKDVEYVLSIEFRLPEVLRSRYLTFKEKTVFVCYVLFKPMAYSIFEFQSR